MDFLTIPLGILTTGSYIEFDNSNAGFGEPVKPNRVIVFGQRLTSGTVAAGVPTQVLSTGAAQTFFGRGSELAIMLAALKVANTQTEVWAVAQDDNPAGQKAVGGVTFAGAPAQNDTFQQYIAGAAVQMGVLQAQTPAQMATAWAAAINALPDLPLTAAVDLVNPAKVDYTANHKGLFGNDIDLRNTYYAGDYVPADMTATITPMGGGTANPSLTASIAALGNSWFVHWVNPYTDETSMMAIGAELDRRFGPTVQAEGHAYSAATGTVGTLTALGLSYNTLEPSIMDAGNMPTHPAVFAAALAGICAYRLGINPSLPLTDLTVPGVLPPPEPLERGYDDRQLLLTDGISTYNVDDDGNVIIDRLISMYRTNSAGVPDQSYMGVERLFQLFQWRWLVRVRVGQKFSGKAMASDITKIPVGAPVLTPSSAALELASLAREQEGTLLQNVDDFVANLVVQIDQNNPGQLDALMPPTFLDQFFVFAGRVQFKTA